MLFTMKMFYRIIEMIRFSHKQNATLMKIEEKIDKIQEKKLYTQLVHFSHVF